MPDFLAHKLAAPLAAAFLILSLIGNGILGLKLHSARGTIGTLTEANERLAGDLATCRLNSSRLEGAVSTQNAAVDGIKAAAETAAAAAKAGQAAAEAGARNWDLTAEAIAATPPPAPGEDRCVAASRLIHDTLTGEDSK